MYETVETRHKQKNDTYTYTYDDQWVENHHPSDNFHDEIKRHNNSNIIWPYHSVAHEAEKVRLGQYYLSPG